MSRSKKIHPDPEWAAKVQADLSFLFTAHSASLADGTYRTDSFGLKTATIHAGNVIFKISCDATLPPDYIESRIASVHAPTEFYPVASAWMALELEGRGAIPSTPPYKEFGTLIGLSASLKKLLPALNEAFAEENYRAFREKLQAVDKEAWRRRDENNRSPSPFKETSRLLR